MKHITAGIIGCGNIAWKWDDPKDDLVKTHAKAYARHAGVRLVACADPNVGQAKGLARRYPGVTPYADYREMLVREQLDIVSVCTTTASHAEVLEHILRTTGVRCIFAEKPLTASLKETQRIAALARAKKATVVVNYLRRWDRTMNTVRHTALPCMGAFRSGSVIYYGGMQRNGIHFLDLLDFFGVSLRAAAPVAYEKRSDGDFAGVHVAETHNGGRVTFTGVNDARYDCLEMDLFFDRGRIRIGDRAVEVFRAQPSRAWKGFHELALAQTLPTTLSTAMNDGIAMIVRQFRRGVADTDALTREVGYMRLMEGMKRRRA